MAYDVTAPARSLRAQGLTYAEVGKHLNVDMWKARTWVLCGGLGDPHPANNRAHSRKRRFTPQILKTAWELRQKGMKYHLIAEHLGVSKVTASRYVRRHEEEQLAYLTSIFP